MKINEPKYSKYALVKEMMDTINVVKNFNLNQTKGITKEISSAGKLLLTGEGSSRIFPAKNAIRKALTWGMDLTITTDGSRQSAQYDLSNLAVFCKGCNKPTKVGYNLLKDGTKSRFCKKCNEVF